MTQEKRIPDLTPFTHASMGIVSAGDENSSLIGGKQKAFCAGNLIALSCERELAIQRDLTAGEYVKNHIRNWNFNQFFDGLYHTQFQHELGHLLLGLAFLKMGRNPTQFDFGYDGNIQAEALVTQMEKPFEAMLRGKSIDEVLKNFSEDDFVNGVDRYLISIGLRGPEVIHHNAFEEAGKLSRQGKLCSIFEYRRFQSFAELASELDGKDFTSKIGDENPNGEVLEGLVNLPSVDIREIYGIVSPVIGRILNRVVEEFSEPIASGEDKFRFMGALRSLYVSDLWKIVQDPEADVELRMMPMKKDESIGQYIEFLHHAVEIDFG